MRQTAAVWAESDEQTQLRWVDGGKMSGNSNPGKPQGLLSPSYHAFWDGRKKITGSDLQAASSCRNHYFYPGMTNGPVIRFNCSRQGHKDFVLTFSQSF